MTQIDLSNDSEKFSYALGLSISANLIQTGVKEINPEAFVTALKDVFGGVKPQISPEEANRILESFVASTQEGEGAKNLEEGLLFLAENLQKEGVTELPSGLQYEILKEGDGAIPTANDQVKCHYHGTLIDGTVFDSSVQRGEPATFPVNGVIQGWVEALQLMSVGSKWKLYIPSELAYGSRGAGGAIAPNTTLIFEVELLEII